MEQEEIKITNVKEKREYVDRFYDSLRYDTRRINRNRFLDALQRYAELKGHFICEEICLFFAHEIEESEPDSFESGIEIRIAWPAVDEDVVIPLAYEEFYPMLCEECEKYLEEHPEDRQKVQELLAKIKVALGV